MIPGVNIVQLTHLCQPSGKTVALSHRGTWFRSVVYLPASKQWATLAKPTADEATFAVLSGIRRGLEWRLARLGLLWTEPPARALVGSPMALLPLPVCGGYRYAN
jgi:hypothetical protein